MPKKCEVEGLETGNGGNGDGKPEAGGGKRVRMQTADGEKADSRRQSAVGETAGLFGGVGKMVRIEPDG